MSWKTGVNPGIGIKIAENLSEEQSVKLVQNYFDLVEKQGQPEERAADLIKRLGTEAFKQILVKDIDRQAMSK